MCYKNSVAEEMCYKNAVAEEIDVHAVATDYDLQRLVEPPVYARARLHVIVDYAAAVKAVGGHGIWGVVCDAGWRLSVMWEM